MGVKVATACLHLSQPSVPHSPSASQTLASSISSPSCKRRSSGDGSLVCRHIQRLERSVPFGISRTRSCQQPKSRSQFIIRRAFSAGGLDAFSDEEFSKMSEELAMRFRFSEENTNNSSFIEAVSESDNGGNSSQDPISSSINFVENDMGFPAFGPGPPDWPVRDDDASESIERKANSGEIPLSLRIIKRKKKQWQEEFKEVGESAYCSVKAAFSSMVFIIRELQSYTLQMREVLFYEDLRGILVRVKNELHASFVWLFQQVFSQTPTLMVYVMVLLANYSVYSMANHAAIAAVPPIATESVSVLDEGIHTAQKFDSSAIKTFSVSSSSGKTTSVGGINGGGGKFMPAASGTDGDGSASSEYHQKIIPDGFSKASRTGEEESISGQEMKEGELNLWNSIVEDAEKMQASSLDQETIQRLVSPVNAKMEEDGEADYFRTELLYQTALVQEPNNPLLLANYAQFLYLVVRDYDRAEDYFKRGAEVEPKDAEALNKYATFLWQARKDLWAAEETYLEAIAADPSNSYYAANYAHFLWNTGGDDTCFPLNSPDEA